MAGEGNAPPGGGDGGDSSLRAPSSFGKKGDRQLFTVELRPGETTIVSWKKLMKDAGKVNNGSASAPEHRPNVNPALESRIAPSLALRGQETNLVVEYIMKGVEHGAVLTLTLNDMGNYGCYPDCAEAMSMPLYTEAMVNLMRKQPMSSFLAHNLIQAFSELPKQINFIQHNSHLGWKLNKREKPIMIDPRLYGLNKSEIWWVIK